MSANDVTSGGVTYGSIKYRPVAYSSSNLCGFQWLAYDGNTIKRDVIFGNMALYRVSSARNAVA